MVTACYIVIYHVADFPTGNQPICHQDAYRDHNNALLVAKDLAKCFDVVDDVYVIDGLTGEVLNTILKDEPQKDTTEEDDVPADNTREEENSASTDVFDDGTGGVWQRTDDGKWDYDCLNLTCVNCAYYDKGRCSASGHVTKEERDILIKFAKAGMKK